MLTPTRLDELVRACFLAGLLPAILAPILWPFVLISEGNGIPTLPLVAIMSISGMALLGGMIGCLLVGIPSIYAADRLGVNRPKVMSIIGAAVSVAVLFIVMWAAGHTPPLQSWPVFVFFAAIGASCGAVASRLSRRVVR